MLNEKIRHGFHQTSLEELGWYYVALSSAAKSWSLFCTKSFSSPQKGTLEAETFWTPYRTVSSNIQILTLLDSRPNDQIKLAY